MGCDRGRPAAAGTAVKGPDCRACRQQQNVLRSEWQARPAREVGSRNVASNQAYGGERSRAVCQEPAARRIRWICDFRCHTVTVPSRGPAWGSRSICSLCLVKFDKPFQNEVGNRFAVLPDIRTTDGIASLQMDRANAPARRANRSPTEHGLSLISPSAQVSQTGALRRHPAQPTARAQ